MAHKVKIQLPSKTGAPLNVYGQMTHDGMVQVWTKHQMIGFYKIERFTGSTLTAASMRALFGAS